MDATTLDTGYIDAVLILLQEEVSTTALAPFGLYETEHGNSLLLPDDYFGEGLTSMLEFRQVDSQPYHTADIKNHKILTNR